MSSIYNFSKNVWNTLKEISENDKSYIFLLLLCCTIPLSLGVNNIALSFFIIMSLVFSFNNKYKSRLTLLLPIAFYLIMLFSYFWSIDKTLTLKAIPKEIALLLIPLTFLFKKKLTKKQLEFVFTFFANAMVFYALYFIIRAVVRYFYLGTSEVFFYHGDYQYDVGLVTKTLNAIHVSIFTATAYFFILSKETKSKWNYFSLLILSLFLMLLSSKNVVLIFIILNTVYYFFFTKSANKMRLRNLTIILIALLTIFSFSRIKERFQVEFQANTKESLNANVVQNVPQGAHYISVYEAWNNQIFTPNDFFPGTSFRVYQARLFCEFLKEENIFWKGFGLNASYPKIEEKGKQYNVFLGNEENEGYQKKNFHNQYLQTFSELGIFGFLVMTSMLVLLLYKGYKNKDFSQIAFAVLLISLFLTESFLWRQRGVVFFSVFYSLFCLKNSYNLEKK